MSKRYLFSTKPGLAAESLLKGLAQAHMITVTTCVVVLTDDDQVAALLDKLETSERIDGITPKVQPTARAELNIPELRNSFMVKREKRHYKSGPMVECKVCHKTKPAAQICKTGECKPCKMRANRLIKSQKSEKSQGQWNSGMPKSDGHHQEHLAELQARPKEKIDLTKLAGRKLS
jgi:hypothetical protein